MLCDEGRPDAFVIREAYEVTDETGQDSTSVRFSLVGVGPRGQADEVGWLRPVAVLAAGYALAAVAVVVVATMARRRRADGPDPDGRLVADP